MGLIGDAFVGITRVWGGGTDRFIEATGGTITYDGDYAIHTFTETGSATFTISNLSTTANNLYDLLVVGGGGGGCSSNIAGGGGGGGQVVYSQSLEFTRTGSFDVFVGAGGSANTSSYQGGGAPATGTLRAEPGQTSSFDDVVAYRGGPGNAGGIWPSSSAHATTELVANGGGSGFGFTGGSYSGEYPLKIGAYGTENNGGNYLASNLVGGASNQSGGGGGASSEAAGNNGAWGLPVPGGNGAIGTEVGITGTNVRYGGGGGGARNSNGGEGGGGDSNSRGADNGVANTGGGGGGSKELTFGTPDAGNGGSGVVIIRYKYK